MSGRWALVCGIRRCSSCSADGEWWRAGMELENPPLWVNSRVVDPWYSLCAVGVAAVGVPLMRRPPSQFDASADFVRTIGPRSAISLYATLVVHALSGTAPTSSTTVATAMRMCWSPSPALFVAVRRAAV